MKTAIIGYGGIGQEVVKAFATGICSSGIQLTGVLKQSTKLVSPPAGTDFPFCSSIDELLATGAEIVAECAGHRAVYEYGEEVLSSGADLLVVSTGALADAKLMTRLQKAAERGNARLHIASGAIGALDALRAAKCSGIESVHYEGRKPPLAWRGSPAEEVVDLDALQEAVRFFSGNALRAATEFPKNSNVAATIALAGIGFEKTNVSLFADPHTRTNQHAIEVRASTGHFRIELAGSSLADSPKTSSLAAYSVISSLANSASKVSF